ncbi:MAG: DUF4493 domain-containing protein [Rikenella sp.]|nr:DUF4493 domain-containing protein [Rikenella sp.]
MRKTWNRTGSGHVRIVALVGIMLASVVGCSRRADAPFCATGSAEVSLNLAVDSIGNEITVGTTKTTNPAEAIDPHEDLAIYVINTKNDTLARWKNFNALPSSRLKFTPGAYKIVAEYMPEEGLRLPSFDSYAYRDEEKFVLAAGETHDCSLVAGLACGKITVAFDESFSYYYPNYSVDVRTVGTDFLNFKKGSVQRSGYFEPGTVRLRFHLITQEFDLITFSPTPLPAIKAGEHYRITMSVGADYGNAQVIVLRTETETNPEQKVEIEVPRYFLPKDAPTYTTTGFENGVAQTLFEGEQTEWSLRTTVPGGISSFVLHIGTGDDALRSRLGLAAGQTEIDLAGLSAEDPMRQRLQDAGFRWGEALNAPEEAAVSTLAWVDFTEAMRAQADYSAAHYDFGFSLTDNYGQTLDPNGGWVAVQATVQYPDMKLVPPVPADIWSSTAYFTIQANYDIFNGVHPTLQYRRKIEGATWNDAVEGDNLTVSALPTTSGDRPYSVQYELTGLNQGTDIGQEAGREYEFRVVVNENRTSQVYALTTETRPYLPNRNFNYYTESALFGVRYVFEEGWATRNSVTTGMKDAKVNETKDWCVNTTYPENGWICLQTRNWGRSERRWGITSATYKWSLDRSIHQNKIAGVFYVGKYDYQLIYHEAEYNSNTYFYYYDELASDNLEEGRGIAWPSRPTSLSLNYIFLPKEDDDNRDRGYICVALKGVDDSGAEVEIAKGEVYLDPYSGKRETATPLTIKLDYSRTDVKATKIDVFFSSSEHYRKDDSPACDGDTYTGNTLKIKDVRLNYEK